MAMELVEGIARMNNSVPQEMLLSWFEKLKFALTENLLESDKAKFKAIGINFLSVLHEEHFLGFSFACPTCFYEY